MRGVNQPPACGISDERSARPARIDGPVGEGAGVFMNDNHLVGQTTVCN